MTVSFNRVNSQLSTGQEAISWIKKHSLSSKLYLVRGYYRVIYKEIWMPIMMIEYTIFARSNTILYDQNACLISYNIKEEGLLKILLVRSYVLLLDHRSGDRPYKWPCTEEAVLSCFKPLIQRLYLSTFILTVPCLHPRLLSTFHPVLPYYFWFSYLYRIAAILFFIMS